MQGTELAHNKTLWFPAEPSHVQKNYVHGWVRTYICSKRDVCATTLHCCCHLITLRTIRGFIERLAIRREWPLFGASRFTRLAIQTTLRAASGTEGRWPAKRGQQRAPRLPRARAPGLGWRGRRSRSKSAGRLRPGHFRRSARLLVAAETDPTVTSARIIFIRIRKFCPLFKHFAHLGSILPIL